MWTWVSSADKDNWTEHICSAIVEFATAYIIAKTRLTLEKNVFVRKLSLLNAMVTASYPDVSLDKNLFVKEGGKEIDVKTEHKCWFFPVTKKSERQIASTKKRPRLVY